MSKGNDVFQVLIPTVAPSVIAPPAALASLAEGAIGFYSYPDNTPIDPTGTIPAKFYAAVGVTNLEGVADINKSAGTHIQAKNVSSYDNQIYVAPVNMVVTTAVEALACGNSYGVKVEIRNQEAYRLNGYNQVVKNYVVPSVGCDECGVDCVTDCVAVVDALIALINADTDAVVTASKSGTTCGTDVNLILTVNARTFADFCSVNLNYFHPKQTEIIVTPIDENFGTATVTTAMKYGQGQGIDVKQMEYDAGGWNAKPGIYRVSTVNGIAREGFQYFADPTGNYAVNNVAYTQDSISGWRGDVSFQRTVFAAKNGAVATAVKSLLDLMFPNV